MWFAPICTICTLITTPPGAAKSWTLPTLPYALITTSICISQAQRCLVKRYTSYDTSFLRPVTSSTSESPMRSTVDHSHRLFGLKLPTNWPACKYTIRDESWKGRLTDSWGRHRDVVYLTWPATWLALCLLQLPAAPNLPLLCLLSCL
jgi:hypothetical protein